MDKGRIEFLKSFLEPVGNSVQDDKVQLFCYINSNCVFSKTIWKSAVAKLRLTDWRDWQKKDPNKSMEHL